MPRVLRMAAAGLRLLWISLLLVCMAADAAGLPPERGVKAAYLLKFLAYVEWPPAAFTAPDTPFVIGVANADDIADELVRIMATRTVNNRALNIRRLKPGDTLDGVQLLFVARSEGERGAAWLRQTLRHPILTVTEMDDGPPEGSIINFRALNGHVRFDVSLTAAERNGLRLSSRLLAVAASVQGPTP